MSRGVLLNPQTYTPDFAFDCRHTQMHQLLAADFPLATPLPIKHKTFIDKT